MPTSDGDSRTDRHRPASASLTHATIIAAALVIIDRDGLDGLSMRRLGTELGVDPMAVYYYLPNKAAVFDGVVEAMYAELDLDHQPSADNWHDQLTIYMRRLRAVLRAHPRAVPLIGTRPVYTRSMLAFSDRVLGRLKTTGLSPGHSLEIFHSLRAYTIGHVLAELGEPVGGQTPSPDAAAATMTQEEFPHLAEAVAGGYRPDEQYERGLRSLLDGYALWIGEGGRPPS